MKNLQKQKDSKQAGEKNQKKMCFAACGCGQVEDEEQLSQRQDRQGIAPIPGVELNADSLVSLTISLHSAVKVDGEIGLYIK